MYIKDSIHAYKIKVQKETDCEEAIGAIWLPRTQHCIGQYT